MLLAAALHLELIRQAVTVTSGRVAAYACVVDNVTGDASFVPAQ